MFKKSFAILPALLFAASATSAKAQNLSTDQPRVLVAYFSMQDGNTGDVARAIVDASGGDIYRIMVAEPYPSEDKVRQELLTQQIEQNILPALAEPAPNFSEYDIIFLG